MWDESSQSPSQAVITSPFFSFFQRIGDFQLGLLLAIGGTALFALKSIFIKFAYQAGIDTVTLLTLRMLIALPFYVLILAWLLSRKNITPPSSKQLLQIMGLGFLGYYLASYLDMAGLNYISAQLERLTLYTYPIMTTLLGWLILKEMITRKIIAALLLTYSGIILLYQHEALQIGFDAHLGVALVAAAALSFSLYVVLGKALILSVGSRLFTALAMIASSLFVVVHFFWLYPLEQLWVSAEIFMYAFLLATVSTLIPSFMLAEAIARIGATRTSILGTAGPVFTIILAVFLLDEAFGWLHLVGLLLVISGVSLLGKK